MQEKKSIKTFNELPETITPLDYEDWRGIGESKAREIFNRKDFPRIKGTGVKQLADKRAVFLYDGDTFPFSYPVYVVLAIFSFSAICSWV